LNFGNSVCFVLGTRPEITKTLGIISALKEVSGLPVTVILTGQQTDLVKSTISEFPEFDRIDFCWSGNCELEKQDPRWRPALEKVLLSLEGDSSPALLVGTGDTNSVLATAQIGREAGIPFLHLEAGIRHDRTSDLEPEERNRRLISAIASYHFCPSADQRQNLIKEGIGPNKTQISGDLSKVSVATTWTRLMRVGAWSSDPVLSDNFHVKRAMCLCTFHRSTSLSNMSKFSTQVGDLVGYFPDVRFVVCARPDTRWIDFNRMLSKASNVRVIDAPAPFTFQKLLAISNIVLTDSAGVQQEAALLNKPCVALRRDFELGGAAPLLEMVKPPFSSLHVKFAKAEKRSRVRRPTRISQVRLEGDGVAKRTARMIDRLVIAHSLTGLSYGDRGEEND
jgi:UDP-N-acetylglucosamine 2-epimerase (non-hydrolysing)